MPLPASLLRLEGHRPHGEELARAAVGPERGSADRPPRTEPWVSGGFTRVHPWGCSPCPLQRLRLGPGDSPATPAWQGTQASQQGLFSFFFFLSFFKPVTGSGGHRLCQPLLTQRGESRAAGAGGSSPRGRLTSSSASLDGSFQDEGWEVRGRRTLHISVRAVNSPSCQHRPGFLPENRPHSSSGTMV